MTTTIERRIYEGMFLFPHSATGNLRAATDHIHDLLKRADAEVISFRKWDERRLAYEVKGNKRGVYFLVYFKSPTNTLKQLERDCELSEHLLRAMVLRADHLTDEQISASDGRSELEDEIKLRAEPENTTTTETTVVTTGDAAEAAPEAAPPAG